MADNINRRGVLMSLGAIGAVGVFPEVRADRARDRFIVDVGEEVSDTDRRRARESTLEVIHELDHLGYLVVEGDESTVETVGDTYRPDVELHPTFNSDYAGRSWMSEGNPATGISSVGDFANVDVSSVVDGFPDAYVWDAATMNLPAAHEETIGRKPSGDPVRIGIIDDGVYNHPHLNVDVGASVDLTGDGADNLHPTIDHYHGTHVAGIAAAHGGGALTDLGGFSTTVDDGGDGGQQLLEAQSEVVETTDPKAPESPSTTQTVPESVNIDNGTLEVDIGERSSGSGANGGGDWFFDGVSTLYRETYGVRDGTNTHYDAENDGTTLSAFPASTSPGSTVSALVEMPIETDGGVGTVELERRVTLDSTDPILRVQWVITNTSGEPIDDLRLSQYVDYDIDDLSGDYGEYFFDAETDCEYIFLEDVSQGILAGFTADVPSVNHSLTEYSTGLGEFTSADPTFFNNDREPDSGTDDVELAIEWSLGALAPQASLTFSNAFIYGRDEEDFQTLLCQESPGAAGEGRHGVAPGAEVVSMRYFSYQEPSLVGDFAAAVDHAIATDCDVINASLGFTVDQPESRELYHEYVQGFIENLAAQAEEHGIVWVASAGNSANDANDLVPGPAKADHVLAVSATGPTGIVRPGNDGPIMNDPLEPPTTPSNFTTHGNEYVDVSAPGGSFDAYPGADTNQRRFIAPDGILSTLPPDSVLASLETGAPLPEWTIPDETGTPYGFLVGTSMAAPQVTGVAALLKAANPDWTPHQIKRVIQATARNTGKTTYHGHGLVDPVAALAVADPEDVRSDLGQPDERDDRGRNETGDGYNPRNGSGRGSEGRGDGDDDGRRGDGRN